ncbi:hypothetical protein ES705_38361 [subsurface metagenome]
MSRGLGKVEKAVLKACCQCFFARATGKQYEYPGGARLLHPENKAYIRGISIGQKQHRMLLHDEKMIDLKEVHFFFKSKHGSLNPQYQSSIDFAMKEKGASFEQAKEIAKMGCGLMGIQTDEKLSPAQEAAYQRSVSSLKKKGYLLDANLGYAPGRFVKINEKKIKPVRPR